MNKKIMTLLIVIGIALTAGITGIIAAPHVPYKVTKSETDSLNSSFYKFTMNEISSDVHKLIEGFYDNFNNDRYLYVCNNLLPQSAIAEISQQKCLEDLEALHKIFGSNVSYDLNSAKIVKEKKGKEIKYIIELPSSFEKYPNANTIFYIISENAKLLIYGVTINSKN